MKVVIEIIITPASKDNQDSPVTFSIAVVKGVIIAELSW